ncbi:hypothetical protein JVT61DRAFT_11972 [Boletus reticuloceps]|uniref:Uncharacterized protein n=1 Tax=Boletus reticuloceps TaxID=495285 RepID=A0A8I3A453_9AGAM|nr:hypothetical protein JVT61DRAFT_11972 [Boletus reticuloceps]
MVHHPDQDEFSNESSGADPATDEESEASDGEEILSALRVPAADIGIAELRKALSLCQKALIETRGKLIVATKDLRTLDAALPAKKRKGILNKTGPLNDNIGRVAKKFAMLYRLWVIDGLFPIMNVENPDVDLRSTACWDSDEAKRSAVLTELFLVMPESLHKEMVKYKSFGSVFTTVLNQERSNMLRAVKEASPLIFATLKVPDATIFASPARKRDDLDMQRLSMKEGMYHRLAPILFADPDQATRDGFLKSPVLVNILRLLMSGKNALTNTKSRGGPRARGQLHGIKSVTEGLIALAAIFARYLLTPDLELQSVGSETKIPYKADYDFYLQHLLKQSTWAIGTIHFFNTGVFGDKGDKASSAVPERHPPAPTRTWEDEFLDGLDNADTAAPDSNADVSIPFESISHMPTGSPVHSFPPSPPAHNAPSPPLIRSSPPPSPTRADTSQTTTSNSMVSIHNHSGATLSSVSRLQVEVGRLSISGTSSGPNEPTSVTASMTSGHRVSSARRALIPVHLPEAPAPPAGSEPLVQKCATRSRAKAKK